MNEKTSRRSAPPTATPCPCGAAACPEPLGHYPPAMLILVSSTAGSGHFGPLVPFVHALAGAGHEVRVATPRSFRSAVESAGFPFEPLGEPSPDELGAIFGRLPELSMAEANRMVVTEVFAGADARAALPAMGQLVDRLRPDLIVREPAEFAGLVAAHARGIPSVSVNIGLDAFLDHTIEAADALARLGLGEPENVLAVRTALDRAARLDRRPTAGAGGDPATALRRAGRAGFGSASCMGDGNRPLVYLTFGSVAAGLGLYPVMYRAALDALADLPIRVLVTTGSGRRFGRAGCAAGQRPSGTVGSAGRRAQAGHAGGPPRRLRHPARCADRRCRPDRACRCSRPTSSTTPYASANLASGSASPAISPRAADGPSMTFPSPGLVAELRRAVEAVLADPGVHERAARAAAEMAELPPVPACVAHAQDLTAG